jgi:hypothetical protein
MIRRHQLIFNVMLAAGFAAVPAACASNSGTGGGPAATAMPLARPPSGVYDQSGAVVNLALDDSLGTWEPGAFSRGIDGPGGAADLEVVGTGKSMASRDLFSAPITITPGKTYTFSIWIDPSKIIDGSAILGIYAPSRMVQFGQVRIKRGSAGRYSVSGKIPKTQSKVRIDFQPNGCTIAAGEKLKIAQPMLMAGTLKTVVPKALATDSGAVAPKTHTDTL